jgi:hypothetical protein
VSGDIVQCPRGSRTLQPTYYSAAKKPVFLHNEACWLRERHHMLRRVERAQGAIRKLSDAQSRSRAQLIEISKTSMKYGLLNCRWF